MHVRKPQPLLSTMIRQGQTTHDLAAPKHDLPICHPDLVQATSYLQSRICERLGLHKPLIPDQGLHDISPSLRTWHPHLVVLRADRQPCCLPRH